MPSFNRIFTADDIVEARYLEAETHVGKIEVTTARETRSNGVAGVP